MHPKLIAERAASASAAGCKLSEDDNTSGARASPPAADPDHRDERRLEEDLKKEVRARPLPAGCGAHDRSHARGDGGSAPQSMHIDMRPNPGDVIPS